LCRPPRANFQAKPEKLFLLFCVLSVDLLAIFWFNLLKMNDTKSTSKELNESFDNFHKKAAEAIAACEAFIAMDINEPRVVKDKPVEAIFVKFVDGKKS
jgi:hypothetical protein